MDRKALINNDGIQAAIHVLTFFTFFWLLIFHTWFFTNVVENIAYRTGSFGLELFSPTISVFLTGTAMTIEYIVLKIIFKKVAFRLVIEKRD